jgi:hypothetical protein
MPRLEKNSCMVVDLASEREAKLLGSRSILIKSVWEYWADGLFASSNRFMLILLQRHRTRSYMPICKHGLSCTLNTSRTRLLCALLQ